ncbi:MAG TPA: hypothetical protein VFK05_15560 [Polyangiaceae bacterium]|nr:hypothetical protein [Polyangiaceae bacterium]
MPPAAISRSSTYLPKICGNIASLYASAALALLLLSGCSAPEPQEIVLPLTVHALESCPIPTPTQVDLSALGDFPTSNDTTPTVSLTAQNVRLGIPSDTLALEASARPESSDQVFIGFSGRTERGLDFLLWPQESPCELYRAGSYPAGLGGEALGFAEALGLALMAGSDGFASSAVVGAMSFDARTGQSGAVDARAAMRKPRAFAAISGFGKKLLVAGGEYPIHESGTPASVFNDTAEVYDPLSQSFESDLVPLFQGVARHAAVPLPSGEVALIGGQTETSRATNFIQVVSPLTRTTKLLGTLALGRSEPTVLRLDDGRLFIAGGVDASGSPVGALEWRAADSSPLPAPFDGTVALPPRFDRAYAVLAGGAVLAVGGCEERAPRAAEDCARECRHGCPPWPAGAEKPAYEAFWITADGGVTSLELPLRAGRPSLLAGSDGSPWLIAGDSELFRFDPWHGRFDTTTIALGLSDAPAPARFLAMGIDSFAWLTQDDSGILLRGVRLATRSAFSNDVPLVTVREPSDPSRPAHLVPDRAPSAELSYEAAGAGALAFAQSAPGQAKSCVWLSDARFSDFSAEVLFSSRESPSLRLGGTSFVAPQTSDANGSCPLPSVGDGGATGRLLLERSGAQVLLSLGDARSNCTIGAERLAVAVCSSELGSVRVTRLSVKRRH